MTERPAEAAEAAGEVVEAMGTGELVAWWKRAGGAGV